MAGVVLSAFLGGCIPWFTPCNSHFVCTPRLTIVEVEVKKEYKNSLPAPSEFGDKLQEQSRHSVCVTNEVNTHDEGLIRPNQSLCPASA